MSNKIMTSPVIADQLIGAGRKNSVWYQTGTENTRQGKMITEKLFTDESKGYLIFEHCGARQRRAVATAVEEVKTDRGKALVFVCHKCSHRVPVLPPIKIEIAR